MHPDFVEQELERLGKLIADAQQLLDEYQARLIFSDDPRERARSEHAIKQLEESLNDYMQKYTSLRGQSDTNAPPSQSPEKQSVLKEDESTCELTAQSNENTPVEVFFSYSHKDEELRDQLAAHLSVLEKNSAISGWHDRQIKPGDPWAHKINERMNSAKIIMLLVSSDFINSDYCWDIEVKRAMERHESGEVCVIPIILRPVNWTTAPFGKLQALPKDAKPVTSWDNRDEAFTNISHGIEAIANRFLTKSD